MASKASSSSPGSTFTIYTNPLAFNPAKPVLVIAEKGFKPKDVKIDILAGQALEPWFMRINPSAAVPVVVDAQGKVIVESLTISKWIDNLDGQPLGGNQVDRQWVDSFVQEVDKFDGNLWAFAHVPPAMRSTLGGVDAYRVKLAKRYAERNPDLRKEYDDKIANMSSLLDKASNDKQAVSQCEAILAQLLDKAEARLSAAGGGPFLGGPAYSIADALFGPVLYRVKSFGQYKQLIEPRAALAAYMQRMQQRPSWKAAFGINDSLFGKIGWGLPAILKSKFF